MVIFLKIGEERGTSWCLKSKPVRKQNKSCNIVIIIE